MLCFGQSSVVLNNSRYKQEQVTTENPGKDWYLGADGFVYPSVDIYVKLPLNNLHLTDDIWDKYMAAVRCSWMQTTLLSHLVYSYCFAAGKFYRGLTIQDAQARGYTVEERGEPPQMQPARQYFRDLRNWDNLNALRRPAGTLIYPASPISAIPDPKKRGNTRRIKELRIGYYNAAMLRLMKEVDQLDVTQLLSRIVIWHFAGYWKKGSYTWQLAGTHQETLTPYINLESGEPD